jgi:predicted nucleic acid-binding protein
MKDKVFLDTNILIYSVDNSPGQAGKRDVARRILTDHIRNDSGVLSTQVLQEFFQVATQKIHVPLSSEEALEYLRYVAILETVRADFGMIVSAVHLHQRFSISFWDCLVLQAARAAGCSELLSEDLQDGFRLGKMRVSNPFA